MYTKNEREMIESPALAIGQALKAEREKSNISLRDIAEHTRLSYANLTALEAGNFESLPGIGYIPCLLYTSPSPRDLSTSRMPSSA